MDDGDDNAGVYSSSSLNDGEWHHVAGVRDRAEGELRVYLDGALENSVEDTTDSSLANANPVVVGGFNNGARYFTGDMDFVRISDKALTSDQFVPTDHHGNGMALPGRSTTGLNPMTMDRSISTTVPRATGMGMESPIMRNISPTPIRRIPIPISAWKESEMGLKGWK